MGPRESIDNNGVSEGNSEGGLTLMEAISIIATHRGTTEEYIVNTYSYRQFKHIATAFMKDKFMIVRSIFSSINGKKSTDINEVKKTDLGKLILERETQEANFRDTKNPKKKKIAARKQQLRDDLKKLTCVVDLDGPLENLAPWVGGVNRIIERKKRQKNKGKK